MSSPLRLSLVGDYRADAVAHQAIPLAIERAARWLNITAEAEWIATDRLDESELQLSDAVWVVPGSPYRNDAGVFDTLRWVRETGKPFLGSCGGFQYALIEYARNVLGWQDASHAETDTEGRMVIAPLSCSLVEQRGAVRFGPGSRIARAYGALESDEGYHCNFGVNRNSVQRWAIIRCALLPGTTRAMCVASSYRITHSMSPRCFSRNAPHCRTKILRW